MGTTAYRFTIVNPAASTPFTVGMATVPSEHWSVNSVRGAAQSYIAQREDGGPWLSIDGQEVDLVTGKVTDGLARIGVADLEGTTGGGVAVNDELSDSGVFARWASNFVGNSAGNWGLGFIEYPAVPPQSSGVTIGGSPNQFAGNETWLSRTFTGLTPSTTYTVQLRYFNRGAAMVFGIGPIGSGMVPFLRVGGTEAEGTQRGAPLITPPNNPPAEYLTITTISSAAGEITVDFGVRPPFNMTVLSFAMGFDWVRITPGNPAITGRYVTINLADADARQQFLGRQAFIEKSYDEGVTWPDCPHSGYITDIQMERSLVYEFGVGDSRRTERITKAFVKPTTNFNNTTMFVGGPTRNGWLPLLPFFGFPTFEIEHVTEAVWDSSGGMVTPGEVILKYDFGPMPNAYKLTGDNLTRENFDLMNERARSFWTAHADAAGVLDAGVCPVNGQRYSAGSFPQLKVEINDINGDFNPGPDGVAGEYVPMSWIASPPPIFIGGLRIDLARVRPWPDTLFGEGGRLRIPWTYNPLIVPPPTVGGRVQLGISTRDISEDAPLHIAMHPVDIVRFIYADYGIAFDITSYAATKDALGAQLKCYMRVTAAENIQSFLEKLFGVFGFSTRVEGGERVFFVLRRKSSTPPSVIVTDDTLREEGGPTFALSESTKCNQVRVAGQRFLIATRTAVEDRAWDDIVAKDQTVVADLVTSWNGRGSGGVYHPIGYVTPTLDASIFGERPVEFTIPGQIYIDGVGELPFLPYARGLAEHVFDRAGRGMQGTTLVTRRGAGVDAVQIGDEIGVDISHHPNAQLGRMPSSQRGGARVATILRREEQPEGLVYTVTDAGTGTVPAGITPLAGDYTFTVDPLDASIVVFDIKPLTGATRHFASDLVGANARIEIQVAFQSSAPTTDGITYTVIDPAEYSYEGAIAVSGDYKIRLGPFPTSTAMWVRIRTFVPGTTPSPWTTWQTVGTGLPPGSGDISNLVVGVATDTTIPISWTNTDLVNDVTVYAGVDGVLPQGLVATLPPGSTQYIITGLIPSTDYDITVILAATGTALTGSATTTNTGLSTLPTPASPIAFTGTDPNVPPGTGTGIYGMKAIALVFPSTMIFEYADETVVGSGIPSTFREWTRHPSTPSGYTVSASNSAANDGRLRYVRAKLRATGYNDSPYTSPIGIDPWLPGVITPGLPGTIPVLPAPGSPGTPGVPGSPLPIPVPATRFIARITQLGLASNTDGTGVVTVGKGSIAYRVTANGPSRLRLYDLAAERTSDAARAIDTEADQDDCVFDVVLHATNTLDLRLKNRVILGSAENPPVDTLFYALTNLSGSTADLVVDIHLTPHEH